MLGPLINRLFSNAMNAGKSLFLFFLTICCSLPVLAFQVQPFPARATSASTKQTSNEDELDLHRSAAESYQLSGDLAHVVSENRQIVSLALIRLASIAAREAMPDRSVPLLFESIAATDTARARMELASAYLQKGEFENGVEQARVAID